MRRFVQALSSGSGLPASLPQGVRAALVELPDHYNISVRQPAGVLLAMHETWHVGRLRWGLVPSWEPEPATRYSTQAARLERAPKSRLYRRAWAERRCLVPITGYYKWDRSSKRQPYFVQAADGAVLFAAALWECWTGSHMAPSDDGNLLPPEPVYSFAVLTHPNPAIPEPLTPDGPVFLSADVFDEWVTTDPRRALRIALRATAPRLEAYAVSRRVADRRLDDYSLLEPADPLEAPLDGLDDDIEDDD